MPITYEKIDITEKSAGLFSATVKVAIDDFAVPYEKEFVLEYRPDRPEYFEKNLSIQTDLFVAEIKRIEAGKKINPQVSLDKVTISANVKYRDTFKAVL